MNSNHQAATQAGGTDLDLSKLPRYGFETRNHVNSLYEVPWGEWVRYSDVIELARRASPQPVAVDEQATAHDYDDPTLACSSCGLTMGESRTLGHIKLGILNAAPSAQLADAPQALSYADAAQWARENGYNVPPQWEAGKPATQPPTAPVLANERAKFEAWIAAELRKSYPHLHEDGVQRRIWKHADGDYMDLQTQHDWTVWQARAAQQAATSQTTDERLNALTAGLVDLIAAERIVINAVKEFDLQSDFRARFARARKLVWNEGGSHPVAVPTCQGGAQEAGGDK